VHVQLTLGGARLVTQMFLPGQPLNASDRWCRAVADPERLVGIAVVDEPDRLILRWDIVIGRQPVNYSSGAIA
jgi:protocatechuate 3,4-dioxygenase beta subunit